MSENIFKGLFDTDLTSVIAVSDFMLCLGISLVLGIMLAGAYMLRSRYTASFLMSLALLPAVVCVVIMMVNGNVGTGVAVAGAFSLVRFRSVPGSAREISSLFIAMGTGLIAGMGYLAYAALFCFVMCVMLVVFSFAVSKTDKSRLGRILTIVISEDIDYTGIFDDIFEKYTSESELMRVKSTNMGSMFRLTYNITLNTENKEKEMIDLIRCRNGNLEVSMSRQETAVAEL